MQQSHELAVGVRHCPLGSQQAEAEVRAASEQSWATADRAEIVADELVQAKTGSNNLTVLQVLVHLEHLKGLVRHCGTAAAHLPGDQQLFRALAADHEMMRSNCHHRHMVWME